MLKAFLLSLLSISLYAEVIGGVAVLVENEPITIYEVSKAMRDSGKSADETVKVLVRQKLESIEAEKRGINVSSMDVTAEVRRIARQNNMTVIEFYEAVQKQQGKTESVLKEQIRTSLINQKLYNAIAFSQMEQPTAEEEEEYYRTHIDQFSKPESFTVLTYRSSVKDRLQAKVNNPMLYAPDVKSDREILNYDAIDPRLAQLLETTPNNTFTPVLPDREGFVSFYIQEKNNAEAVPLDEVREEIKNRLMGEKRQQVLNDYFSRLQLTADVRIIRLP
ncbi:MAG: peptidylprolyl isomerase [Sulfurimonadaceae bacterium]|nr:peptidylprolyl isomerase [Sulfurimonadaceae bacterium]